MTTATPEAPAWARGYDLEELKSWANLFRQYDGPIPQGRYGGVKETAIAEWLEAGWLVRASSPEGEPLAAIVDHPAGSARGVHAFADQPLGSTRPGDLRVRRVAWAPGRRTVAVKMLRDALAQLSPAQTAWLELWVEHPETAELVEELGLVHRGTRVKASAELVGWYTVGAPPEYGQEPLWTLSWSMTAGLQKLTLHTLPVRYDPAPALGRLMRHELNYAGHYSNYHRRGEWSALALAGYAPPGATGEERVAHIEKPSEMSKRWKEEHPGWQEWPLRLTALWEALPEVVELVRLIPASAQRVRLMRLAPGGGELTRHADVTDEEAGVVEGQVARVHFPLKTNPEVVFRSWGLDGRLRALNMGAGWAHYLDMRKPHTAVNGGTDERIHLVVDYYVTPTVQALLQDGIAAPVIAEAGAVLR